MSNHTCIMKNWKKVSHRYHQILLLNNSSGICGEKRNISIFFFFFFENASYIVLSLEGCITML